MKADTAGNVVRDTGAGAERVAGSILRTADADSFPSDFDAAIVPDVGNGASDSTERFHT